MDDFLSAKGAAVRRRRAAHVARGPMAEGEARCADLPPAPSLMAALAGGEHVAVMAEYKRRSPSAGPLARGESPVDVAAGYLAGGAAAVSVLTDADDFGGSLADLAAVAVSAPRAPVLRKDFLVEPDQVHEARRTGAAAVLLIVALLDDAELRTLLRAAELAGCEALVEVHDLAQLERAATAGARLVGINNRDLRRLTTNLAVTERLAPRVPEGTVVVSESGVRTAGDVRRVRDAGAHAVLVGEALLRQPPALRGQRLRELAGVRR